VSPALAPAGVFHLKQVSTLGAAKIGPRFRARNPASAPETAQLMQVIAHNSLVLAYQCAAILAVDAAAGTFRLEVSQHRYRFKVLQYEYCFEIRQYEYCCHPERSPPQRTKSKDLWLLFDLKKYDSSVLITDPEK
jgi:hypothetical protein